MTPYDKLIKITASSWEHGSKWEFVPTQDYQQALRAIVVLAQACDDNSDKSKKAINTAIGHLTGETTEDNNTDEKAKTCCQSL